METAGLDRARIFSDRLQQVTSVLPWKGRPAGHGRPGHPLPERHHRRRPCRPSRSPLHRLRDGRPRGPITNLRFALDNWIYASNNGRTGEITFSRRPDAAPSRCREPTFAFAWTGTSSSRPPARVSSASPLDDWGTASSPQHHPRSARGIPLALPAPQPLPGSPERRLWTFPTTASRWFASSP